MQTADSSQATIAERQELERHAYNVAFRELDLDWYWDPGTFSQLQSIPAEDERVRAYLRSHHEHLLKAYDAEFLVGAIREMKSRCIEDARMHRGGH